MNTFSITHKTEKVRKLSSNKETWYDGITLIVEDKDSGVTVKFVNQWLVHESDIIKPNKSNFKVIGTQLMEEWMDLNVLDAELIAVSKHGLGSLPPSRVRYADYIDKLGETDDEDIYFILERLHKSEWKYKDTPNRIK